MSLNLDQWIAKNPVLTLVSGWGFETNVLLVLLNEKLDRVLRKS